MRTVTVRLVKPAKQMVITYQGGLILEEPDHLLVHARWDRDTIDLGYAVFARGDHLYEHYYTEKWYTIFELRDEEGRLKGWYCNIARPAQVSSDLIVSEDLELDLFVSSDRLALLRLDVEEFEALGLAHSDPETYAATQAALMELEHMARVGLPPFG